MGWDDVVVAADTADAGEVEGGSVAALAGAEEGLDARQWAAGPDVQREGAAGEGGVDACEVGLERLHGGGERIGLRRGAGGDRHADDEREAGEVAERGDEGRGGLVVRENRIEREDRVERRGVGGGACRRR